VAWGALCAEGAGATRSLGISLDTGPLSVGVGAAGTLDGVAFDKVQNAIIIQREDLRHTLLDRDIRQLDAVDPRHVAFFCADPFSTQLISAPPLRGLALGNADWTEGNAQYYGLWSPICCRHFGERILGGNDRIDRYGSVLAHPRVLNLDNIRTIRHNSILDTVVDSLKEGGIDADAEPHGLFADCAGANRDAFLASLRARNQRLMPDARLCRSCGITTVRARAAALRAPIALAVGLGCRSTAAFEAVRQRARRARQAHYTTAAIDVRKIYLKSTCRCHAQRTTSSSPQRKLGPLLQRCRHDAEDASTTP